MAGDSRLFHLAKVYSKRYHRTGMWALQQLAERQQSKTYQAIADRLMADGLPTEVHHLKPLFMLSDVPTKA